MIFIMMFGPDSAGTLFAYNYGRMPSRKIPEPGNNREKNTKMIDGIYDVAFRCTRDDGWEAYALSHSAYGFGDNLGEARKDITEALALLVEQPENRIRLNEYHERLILAADEHHADVWLRAHHETDPNHALSCREIVGKLQNEPEAWDSFDNGLSLNGDIIVLACLPDDILGDVFTQVASAHRSIWQLPTPRGFVCGVCTPMRPPTGHPNPKSTLHPSTWVQALPLTTSFEQQAPTTTTMSPARNT